MRCRARQEIRLLRYAQFTVGREQKEQEADELIISSLESSSLLQEHGYGLVIRKQRRRKPSSGRPGKNSLTSKGNNDFYGRDRGVTSLCRRSCSLKLPLHASST